MSPAGTVFQHYIGARYAEFPSQQALQRQVGLILDGRGGQADFQSLFPNTHDFLAAGAGLDVEVNY